jgi:penicillin G amidase
MKRGRIPLRGDSPPFPAEKGTVPKGMRPLFRWIRRGLVVLAVLIVLTILVAWLTLRASLPELEGEAPVAGLSAPVSIERDALGVPVIRGGTSEDVARATGYAHAQDRFFQMDLLRRTGAGELSALLGSGLLDVDRRVRVHQFRKRAGKALAALDARDRGLLESYAAGVNAALTDAGARPFEYFLLFQIPRQWRAEDCLLVVYAMWIDLQGLEARSEQRRGRLAAVLPEVLYRFVTNPDPEWEAPLDGSRLPQAPLPTAEQYDLRKLDPELFREVENRREIDRRTAWLDHDDRDEMVGSNNWAVAKARSANGGAWLANDMHLGLRVPNIWYRARLVVAGEKLDVTGVTLPGVPGIIAGSNGHVAWGFTNSYGDFQDLIALAPGPEVGTTYLTADGTREFEEDIERIEVAGGEGEDLIVKRTIWGPVIGEDGEGHQLALAWTAHREGASDMALLALQRAKGIEEAASIIGGAGMPGQNVMLADSQGRIGWVLSGKLPRRSGFDAERPAAWHEPGVGWNGWVAARDTPRLLDPPQGYAWSANARVIGGAAYARIGDGDYAPAARALQIRDRLEAMPHVGVPELLSIQLDDRADYVAHWQPLAVAALQQADQSAAARLVGDWSGHAAIDDAGFRLLREFERRLSDRAFWMLTVEAQARWPDFSWRTPQRFTEVAWRLVHERPANLLDPRFENWDAWLADVANETVRAVPVGCTDIAVCNWGRVNTALIQHPISEAVPFLSRWLDMPADKLPGDWSTPRVQSPTFGASERFGVSPGREAEGYLHMPGGQSGHPLSHFYRNGHGAWVRGEATPFLPGAAEFTLTLVPKK